MMQPSHQDPSLRYARSLMKEAQHQLWWKPGVPGRGFVQRSNGLVHTWPESEGSHGQMASAKGLEWPDVERSSFLINPQGQAVFPYMYDERAELEPQMIQALQGASSRLQGRPYDPNKGIAQAYGKTADYYHVAPTTERNRIQQHGLQPSQPMNNPDWGRTEDWETRHGQDPQIPMGVYGWPTPGQAYNYVEGLDASRDTPHDVWRIPDNPERVWNVDPDITMGENRQPRWTGEPVMDPVLHEGPEHRVVDNFGKPYEEQWNNYKPLNLNLHNNADYEELWNQRVGAHNLWWQPGSWGRGLVHNGDVYTWPQEEATHEAMSHGLKIPFDYDSCFAIDPSGLFRTNAPRSADTLIPQIMSASSRLQPHPYYHGDWLERNQGAQPDQSGEGMWAKPTS